MPQPPTPESPTPPRKRPGQALGRRSLNGTVKDVASLAAMLGVSEGKVRSAAARGMLPHRRWGGRVVFLAQEVEAFLAALPGVSAKEALENVKRGRGDE